MTILRHVITCSRSGLVIGTLDYATVAGHMPYLSHWKDAIAYHPVFSLPTPKLLAFARNEYNALAAASEDGETNKAEDNLLQVCFLAILHSLGSIKQEAPSLPPIHIVQSQMQRLFSLAYWYMQLGSERFHFPDFKINRFNSNDRFENISYYLDACFDAKDSYQKGLSDIIEADKARQAEEALRALRNSWVVPTSNRALYKWVRAHLPARYEADGQGWMSTLFLGNERTILDFDPDETDLMEQIIVGECPAGTGILAAVRARIDKIRKIQIDHKEAFTVDFEEFATSDAAAVVATPEPQRGDFETLVAFIRAKAEWQLKQRAVAVAATPPKPRVTRVVAAITDDSPF